MGAITACRTAALEGMSSNAMSAARRASLYYLRRRTMDDADLLRNHATRLFALAEKARQKGHPDYADELTSLAREVIRHAVMIERRFRNHAA